MRTVALLALSALLVGCGDSPMPTSRASRGDSAEAVALGAGNARLAAVIHRYHDELKKLPATLDALRTWATTAKAWEPADDKLVQDPWGRPLIYFLSPMGGAYTIRSSGPDGTSGTDDDLTFDSRDGTTRTWKDRNEGK